MHIFSGKNVFPPKLTELLRLWVEQEADGAEEDDAAHSAIFERDHAQDRKLIARIQTNIFRFAQTLADT